MKLIQLSKLMKYSSLARVLSLAILLYLTRMQPCDASCQTCVGSLETECATCDDDFVFQSNTSECVELSIANGNKFNTQTLTINQGSTTTSPITSFFDGTTTYSSVAAYITASTNDSLITLFPTYTATSFHEFQVSMTGLPVAFKYSIKITGQFASSCATDQVSILRVGLTNPVDFQILALTKQVGISYFYRSTKYFQPDSSGALTLTLSYTGSDLGTCGKIIINSIVIVGFICDANCSSCTLSTPCTCSNASQYLTGLNTCANCPTGCQTCFQVDSSVTCTACKQVSSTQYYLLGASCLSDCGDGFYKATDASNKPVCMECPNLCATCINSNTCLTCKVGYVYYGGSNCGACPYGQYANSSTTCDLCDVNCESCVTTSTKCKSCGLINGTQSYLYSSNNTCYTICPNGTYAMTTSGAFLCASCPTGCSLCSLNLLTIQCTQCKAVSGTNFYLSVKSCVVTCPSGTYGQSGNLTCMPCTSPCETCSAQGNTFCNSCATGRLIYGTNTCGTCPSVQYADTAKTCALCDSNCLTCSSTPTNCLTCGTLSTFQSYLYSDKKCYVNCPSGSYNYNNSGSYECVACTSGCALCSYNTTSSAVQCTLCTSIAGVQFYLKGKSCVTVTNCGDGFYGGISNTFEPTCLACVSPCGNCISSSACLTCTTGALVLGTTYCTTLCPIGQFLNNTNSKCQACDSNCLTCSSLQTCTSCGLINGTQSYLYSSNNTCYTICPNGTYAMTTSGAFLCASCPTGCSLCSLNLLTIQCTQCKAVSGTNFYLSVKSCVVTCPSGTYGQSGNLTCMPCTSPCETCSAQGNTFCNSCATGRLIYGTNTCGTCPSVQYADTAKTCALCDSNCLTCSSTPTNCLTCGTLSTFQSYLYSDKKCYVNCPSGSYNYNNSGSYECVACTSGCALCSYNTTSSAVQCTLCTSIAGVQFYLKGKSCVTVTNCGDGFYGGISNTFEPTCLACVSPCGNCISSSACLTCTTGALVLGTTYCTTLCPIGQFLNNTNSKCQACDSNCLTCSSLQTCTSCGLINGTQSYLYSSNNTCYTICPNGTYAMTTSGAFLCASCPTGCSLCSLNLLTIQCTQCKAVSGTNFYLSVKSCVVTCPSGTYGQSGNLTCMPCTSPCETCSAQGNTFCNSCATGRLIYGTNTCGTCPSVQYADTAKTCALCDSNCLTCSSTPTNCLTCGTLSTFQSYLYSDKKCYVNCPSGSYNYNNSGSYECVACTSGCALCSYNTTSSAVQCTLCTSIAGVQFYLKGKSCVTVTNCGDGFYGGISNTFEPTCLACVSPCGNCISSSACLTCTTGALVLGTTYCTTLCPIGQFLNNTNSKCQACDSNCLTCSSLQTCTSCGLINGTQSYLYSSNNTCYTICPNGTYAMTTSGAFLCASCPTGCSLCSLNLLTIQCTQCKAVSGTNFYLSVKSCVVTCPSGTYGQSGNLTCMPCTSPCETCSAQGNTFCNSCATGRLIYGTNTCGTCPSVQYADTAKTCALCDSNCLTCSSTPTNCLTCGTLSTFQSYLYSDKKCYVNCPSGSYNYNNSGSYECVACTSGCALCSYNTTSSAVQCTLCTSIAGVQFYLKGKSCVTVTNCGDGFYGGISNTFEPTCLACVSPCGNCISSSACLTCTTGALVLGTTYCTTLCPIGQFLNNTNSKCQACDSNCLTCSSLQTCTSCGLINGTQSYLYSSNNTCYTICPNGTYAMTTSGAFLCASCPTGCSLCSLNLLTIQCTQCKAVSGTNFYLSVKSCVVTCPSGTYGQSGNLTCMPCTSPCETCSAQGNTFCNSCATGRLIYGTNTCGTCPSVQYADTAKTCALCDSNCLTCSSTPTNCLTCGTLSTFQSYLYSDKKCYVNCPSGSYNYNNSGSYECVACTSGCALCSYNTTSSAVQCTLCTSIAGVQFYLKGKSCVTVTNCGDGFYGGISNTFEPTCLACVSPCGNCISSSACLTCTTGALVLGTTYCTTLCPIGQFLNNTNSKCQACDSNCLTCSSLQTCTSCGLINGTQSYLYSSNNTCYTICPNGTYAMTTSGAFLCASCPTGCSLCSLNLLTIQCTQCKAVSGTNFYLSVKSCVVTCPSGTYGQSGNLTCMPCTSPCETCSAQGNTFCNSCATGRLIYGTNTCGTCPSVQYADTAKTCALCDSNCLTCSSTPTNCLTCGTLSTFQSYLYSDKKCYVNCPSGSYNYNNSGSYECVACTSGCALCSYNTTSSAVQCTLCTSIAGVQFYLKGKSCVTVTNCGDGFYGGISNTFEPTCLACVSPCGNCISSSACLTCTTGALVLGTTYCTTLCPIGQFLNNTNSKCQACDSNCLTCSSLQTCTSCGLINGTQSYLYSSNNTCYTICPNGTYAMTTSGAFLCASCPTGCSLCSLNLLTIQCTQCKAVSGTNFYLSVKSCVVTCPSGTYGQSGNLTCMPCTSPCETCSAQGNTFCNSCATGRLIYGTNTCGTCPSVQYADTAKTCALCDSNCLTCSSTPTNCLTCGTLSTFQSYLYSDKKCYVNCPSGSYNYNNSGSYECVACTSGCALCSYNTTSSAVQCTLCTSIAGVQFYLKGKSCVTVTNCGDGFYGGISNTFEPTCLACVSPCGNCISSSACLTCTTGVLVLGTTFCSTHCPLGQFANATSMCYACSENCATCTQYATCTSCGLINGTQSYLYSSNNTCYTICPNGTYAMTTSGAFLCASCPTGCSLCSLNLLTIQCTQCKAVSGTNFYLSVKSCVVTCPSGTYGQSGNLTCMPCTSPCETCSAQGNTFCNSCATGRLIYGTNTCGTCPSVQYADTAKTCALCDSNCLTCSSTPTNCLTCGTLSTFQSYLYSDKKCYVNCPSGSYNYNNSGSYECVACTSGCALCSYNTTSSAVQCTLCTSIAGVQFYLKGKSCVTVTNCGDGFYGGISNAFEPTCLACVSPCGNCISSSACLTCTTGVLVFGGSTCPVDCPVGQYANTNSTCALCNINCATCVNTSTTCLSCGTLSNAQSYLYSDNVCYVNCPTSTYKYIWNYTCLTCDISCNGCYDSSISCIQCNSTYYRIIGSTSCTKSCGDGYYGNTLTITCTSCPIGCATCTMNSSHTLICTKCSSFAGITYYLSGIQCVSLCASGTYQGVDNSTLNYTCIECTSPCATCSGSSTYCTSCSLDRLIFGQNSCGDCPEGQYADTNSTCALCSPNCKTCSAASNNCTSCSFSTQGYQLFLHSDNLCYQTCPNDYFGNKTSSQCSNCHPSCQGCINSDANCILCASSYYRVIGSNACTDSCGVGLYGNNNTGLCTVCLIGCSACNHSASQVTCSACQPVAGVQYYLNSTSCLVNCPTKYFGTISNTSYVCQPCSDSCATCRNSSSQDCLTCSGNNYLSYGIFKCVSTCPDGQFSSIDNKCAVCNINCQTCNITAINCLTCGKSPYGVDLFLFGSACISTCPVGYYSNSTSHQCLACNSTCLTCNGPLPTNCLSCTTGSFLPFNNSCSTACLAGQYPMNNLCNPCISTCLTCQNMTYCTSCPTIAGQIYYLDPDNVCSIVCPSGTYADNTTNTCVPCNSPCQTCLGGINICLSCNSTSSTPFLIYGTNECTATCPDGQFSTNTSSFCFPCSSNCLTCNNTATNCLTCGLSLSAGLQLYLSSGTCLANCPMHTYGASGNICSSCDVSCLGCTLSSTNCISCNTSYYRQSGSSLCINPCPDGYYADPGTRLCTLCPYGCKICSYNSTAINCTVCQQSAGVFYYLQTLSNTCVPQCPSKYYADLTSLTCLPCAGNCSTCLDASSCLTCANGTLLGYGDTNCYSVCPDGQYNSNGSTKCQPCSVFCLTCANSSTTCTTCTTVGGAAYYLSGNMCTATCPFGTYGSLSNFTCMPCAAGCESCFSSLTTTCYTCAPFNASLNYYLVYASTICQSTCPNGQYISGFKCLLCDSNCLTCETNSSHCLTCGFYSIGANLYLYSNKCVLNCPNGYWGNATSNNCDQCAVGCATCFSSGLSACTVCGNDSTTVYYKHIGSSVCNVSCPNGQFVAASVPNLCQPCSPNCVTCQGAAENCTAATCAQNFFFLNNECLSVCPNNYYADRTLRQCLGCANGCLTCFGGAVTQCTVCNTSFFLQIGLSTCAATCNAGEFANSLNSQCALCVSACATCTSLTVCQSCQSVNGVAYFLSGSSCNFTCPSNQFGLLSTFTCTNCSDGCATCFAAGLTNCNSCGASSAAVNFFLIYGTTICNQSCPDGQYANATSFKCLLCSANCLTCVNTSTTCTSCGFSTSGYLLYLYNNTCLLTCNVGYYRNPTSLSCELCMSACSSCQTYSLLTCSSCQNVNNSGTIIPYYKYIGDTICGTSCPLGQYIDDTNSPNKCLMCDANCVGCVGSATNCTIISGCKVNLYYNNATNSCVSICPDGTYANVVTKFCEYCTAGCELCYGSGLSKCTKCLNSTVNYYLMINLHQCSPSCNPGEYGDPAFFMCSKCNSACATCESLTNCTSCQSLNGVAYYLNISICTVICPTNQFGNSLSFKCINCADQCATCFGGSNNQCKTCTAVNGTNYYLIFGTNTCNLTCPDGQYANSTDYSCKLCSSVCLTCNINSTYCMTCGFLTLGYNVYLYNHACLATCPNGYWGNATSNNCDQCAVGCATCFSSGLSACTVCGNDSTTVYYKHIGSSVCNVSCPNGQFVAASVPNLCQPCSPNCVTCQGAAENCTAATCAQNFFFLNNECLSVCPNNYYADRTLRQCLGCANGCLTCFGGAVTQCTVCNTSFFLQIGLSTCAATCNAGEFANSLNSQCALCVSACATCTSPTVCQSCQSVNGVAYFLSGSSCNFTCPSNQFGLLSTFTCTNCSDGCATCFAAGLTNCNSCGASSAAVNFFLVYGTTICNQSCPDGQYANATSFKCLLCSANCLTCVNTSKLCLTCGFSTSGVNLFLFDTACLFTCPNGYFANTLTNTCDPCHSGCATCTGPLLTNCTICSNFNNSGTMVPYYKVLDATTCDTACPIGQYIILSSNLCGYCSSGCISCSVSASNCTINACAPGFYYLDTNSSCITSCPNNYYANSTTGLCTLCTPGCQLCFGGGLTACTQCQTTSGNISYFKVIDINTCTTVCPPGQYPYYTLLTCRYCSAPCLTCNTSDVDCQTCRNISGVPYFNLNNQCLQTCPDGYYGQVSNNTCKPCPVGCSLCFGSIQTKCTQCTNDSTTPYYLISLTTICSTSCPDGQYSNATANSCFKCYENCNTCVGTSTYCTTCTVTTLGIRLFLENNTCLQDCSVSMYKYALNNTCLACNIGCLTCTGPSLNQCQACRNYTDSSNVTTIYYLTIGNSICGVTCPLGQYIRSGYPNYCQICSIQCIGCETTSTNCIEAYLCSVGFFFYRATNSCLTACPNGYYANSTTKYCEICVGGCSLCTAGNLDSCSACKTDPNTTVPYYKEIYMSSCVDNCINGEYQVLSDHSCQPCHPSCVLCNSSSTICQQCKNVSGQVYYYFAQQCLINCPNGMYGQNSNNTCVVCNLACSLCFGPSTLQCYACRPDNSTGLYYYLSYGTNFCITECLYGQYAVNGSFTCQPCNMNCATCYGTSTYCTSCTYVSTINIVYLHNNKCKLVCPNNYWMNSTVALDHQCSPCHSFCLVCTGPSNAECTVCANRTINGSQVNYYKDLLSTTCNTTCPDGQFISDLVPNICSPCNFMCLLCSINSTNCFRCAFNYYLFVPLNNCVSQCPPNYYNDPVMTSNLYYCTQCTSGCLTCTGPGLAKCQTCQNVTINGTTTTYFKDPTSTICSTGCPVGYFGNVVNNNCDPCQAGCVNCSDSASNCFSCRSAGGNDYFKAKMTNSCVTVCPDGYYGNSTDYTCRDCIYYTLKGTCILTCPSGTFAQASGSKSICQDCNATNVTGNPCNRSYTIKVQTTVGNGGTTLVHKVILSGGLSNNISTAQISSNLSVNVVTPSRRRLMLQGRLLAVNTPLSVSDVSISSDRSVIYITTNYQQFDFSTANVVVNFPAGTLVSSDGLMYQSTTASFPLSSPVFMQSYYKAFKKNISLGAQGMIFVILSLLLLAMQLVIANRKGYHQALSFIMTLQVLGLMRAKEYPIDFNIFSVLLGYSYYELSFIPNPFAQLFPPAYLQNTLQPLAFSFTYQNLIYNTGSIMIIFLSLQVLLGIYFILKNDRPLHLARMKLLHETLICLFMVLVLYFSCIGLMSASSNSLSGMSMVFLASVLISLFLLICYSIYFLVWVRPFRLFELYKFNNALRVVGLVILTSSQYGGIIFIDLMQILFVIVDLSLYRHQKLNLKTYVAERILIIISFNSAIFSPNVGTILGLMGTTMALVFLIKLYYTAITTKDFIDEMKLQQASEIDVSDIVNVSVKQKAEDGNYAKVQAKQILDQKLNHSDNFMFNESVDISQLQSQPTKQQIHRIDVQDSSDREQEKRNNEVQDESSSEHSQGELIVYLDPDDYKEEFLRKREQKLKEKEKEQKEFSTPQIKKEDYMRPVTQMKSSRRNLKVDGMRTGANFYPRARGPQNHQIVQQDVQVIKVEPNRSQVDQSDIVSENSEGGYGWLDQHDERNISRARQNKTVWKIMDQQQQQKKK